LQLLLILGCIQYGHAQSCERIVEDPEIYYDLKPLASTTDYHSFSPTETFDINVCRQLACTDYICYQGTGVCGRSSFSSTRVGWASYTFDIVQPGTLQMTYPAGNEGRDAFQLQLPLNVIAQLASAFQFIPFSGKIHSHKRLHLLLHLGN